MFVGKFIMFFVEKPNRLWEIRWLCALFFTPLSGFFKNVIGQR